MDELEGLLEFSKSEGIFIDIGTKMYLDIEGVTFPVNSIFIGLLKDEFLLITLPKRYKSVQSKLYQGSRMVIKYLFDGSVFSFQTSVIEMITDPIRALALEYPKVVQRRELRNNKRRSVVIPGRVEAKKANFPVVVNDISKRGCRFIHQDKTVLREGDLIRVFFKLPGYSGEIGAMADIRNIRREGATLSIGAEFQNATREFLTPVIHFLLSIEGFE